MANDQPLQTVLQFLRNGWPAKVIDSEISPYFPKRDKILEVDNCLLYEDRVIVPTSLRSRILKALHIAHPDMTLTYDFISYVAVICANREKYSLCFVNPPAFQSLELKSPAFQSLGLKSPAFQSLGLNPPAFQAPGLNPPAFQSLGLNSPAFQSPGLNLSKFHQYF
ncbi:hypothetical protein niasHT_022911 [Heterodera trifolii]|uniref:Uncharacterized protein n=1 Tax=Heterodera trifolii TaxID=157864 RepID=A0ABD2JYG3_9BILA